MSSPEITSGAPAKIPAWGDTGLMLAVLLAFLIVHLLAAELLQRAQATTSDRPHTVLIDPNCD